jgi:REP-associated tyrosine transposase
MPRTNNGVPCKNAPRLAGFDYLGPYRYFLTICVQHRLLVFADAAIVSALVEPIRQAAASSQFAVPAYCFMPDHLHLLVEGLTVDADLRDFVRILKQRTSFQWKQIAGAHQELWQRGYYDRVLRKDEDTRAIAGYILGNPVRAGLVEVPAAYAFSGSFTLDLRDLLGSI